MDLQEETLLAHDCTLTATCRRECTYLRSMKINGDNVYASQLVAEHSFTPEESGKLLTVGTGGLQHVGDKPGADRSTRLVLLVLTSVGEVGAEIVSSTCPVQGA